MSEEKVQPPEGASLFGHTGGALIDVSPDRPLPHGVAGWGWHGLGKFLTPGQFPHGQYAQGEAEALAAKKKEAVMAAVAGAARATEPPPVPDWVHEAREKARLKIEESRRERGLTG